jgi:hypothetical protein
MRTYIQRVGYLLLISVIILTGVYSEVTYSQISPNYQTERSVLDAGGGERSSTNYRLYDSLGQPAVAAVSTSPNYVHTSGFSEGPEQSDPGPDPTPTPGSPIPEPGTIILFGTGVFGLFMLMRRKLRKRN